MLNDATRRPANTPAFICDGRVSQMNAGPSQTVLSDATSCIAREAGVRPAASRRSAVLAAVAPTARVAQLGAAALTIALAAVPSVIALARGDTVVSTPLIMAGLLAGATLAWAVEDQAADLLASMPVSSPVRTSLRVGLVALVSIIGAALIALVVAIGPGLPPDLGDRLVETAAAAAAAISVGLVASRRGERAAGPVGITAGVLTVGVVAALAVRWPTILPALGPGSTHNRWWLLALAGIAIAVRAGRDPGRR